MTEDPIAEFRRRLRREYLRHRKQESRAAARKAGARRIDVTLKGQALANYETVRTYLQQLNTQGIANGVMNQPKQLPDGKVITVRPIRLSDTEVIAMALMRAARAIREAAGRGCNARVEEVRASFAAGKRKG
jgi:hypothetical protein